MLGNYFIQVGLWIFKGFMFFGVFLNGVVSGYPWCCVLFFSKRAMHGEMSIGRNTDLERGEGNHVEYVQCDKCHQAGKETQEMSG
jgi:hypothetical protein